MEYWFNTTTGQVETDDDKGQGANVLGPYPTREEAAAALTTAKSRTEAWDDEDREWDARGNTPSGD